MTFDIEHWEMNKSGVERLGECIFTLHNRGGLQGTGGDGDVSGLGKYRNIRGQNTTVTSFAA